MKKRVFSILLALALCLTLLPAAAWAEVTGTGETTCTHENWEYVDDEEGLRHIQECKNCPVKNTPGDSIHREGSAASSEKGKCEICGLDLAVSLNNDKRGRCVTTWEKAFSHVNSQNYYPITDITENVKLNNANGEPLKIHMAGYKATGKITVQSGTLELYLNPAEDRDEFASTISEIEVKGGTLNVTGNDLLTINTLTVTGNGTVQLSGGTYGTITTPAGKSVNDLLAPGYYAVQTANGTSVQQAPITSVTVSVANNENTVYGYTAEQAPVLTATVTPSDLQGVTYQWYEDAVDETPIPGATDSTYKPIGLDATGTGSIGYYCKATIGGYTATSNIAAVTIQKAPSVVSLPDVKVNQVFSDTAEKTINLYDYIRTELNQLKAAAEEAATPGKSIGAMQFKGNGYTPAESIQNGWTMGTETGVITYTIAENQSKGTQITISYKVGFESRESLDSTYILNHEDAEGKIIITLTGVVPTGTPNYTPITTEGKTLADVNLNADNNAFSVPGTVEWVLEGNQTPEDVTVEKGASYAWKFTPDEDNSATYEGLTGTIIPWTESGSGTVIVITPPEQTTDNTTNPATGAAAQPALGLALLAAAVICMDSKLRRK